MTTPHQPTPPSETPRTKEFNSILLRATNASFDCGEYPEENADDETYGALAEKSGKAKTEVIEKFVQLERDLTTAQARIAELENELLSKESQALAWEKTVALFDWSKCQDKSGVDFVCDEIKALTTQRAAADGLAKALESLEDRLRFSLSCLPFDYEGHAYKATPEEEITHKIIDEAFAALAAYREAKS